MTRFRKLYNLASTQIVHHSVVSCYYCQLKNEQLGQDIYKLACESKAVSSLAQAEILPVFFTAEAIEELLKLPNMFWFWHVIKESVVGHDDPVSLVGLPAVKRAMSEMRVNAARGTDLRKDIAHLTQVETAYWVASGYLLVMVGDNWEKSVVRNPIYEYND